jgi:chromosome transmission fidelity protein 18
MYIKRPILFICNDPYTKGLRELRAKARILHFGKIKTDKLYETLRNISTKEKVGLTNEDLVKICELNQNDIRSSVSMMEYIAQNKGGDVAPKGNQVVKFRYSCSDCLG